MMRGTAGKMIMGGFAVLLVSAALPPPRTAAQETGLPAGIRDSQDPRDVPSTPEQSLARIDVPDGFSVSLFAAEPDVSQPIAFTFDDRGRLWVVECFSHPHWKPTGKDRVLIFEDLDNDGHFDKRTVFWDRGNYLSGIAVGHGGVFLCNTPNLIFIPDRDRDDVPDGKPQVLLDGWTNRNPNNVLNNLRFGPDGWLYGCIGEDTVSRVGKPGTAKGDRHEISRGIWRWHPYDATFEVVALGAVNPWGLDFNEHGEAFFTNCVLPHLWHLVYGAYYERRPGEQDNPYVYQRIGASCDHQHWAPGDWTASRGAHGAHGAAGGGHAHTGAMIYLGGAWPDKYWGTFFTGNIHGNRINNDTLFRDKSGYTGSHAPDFLLGNSPWFRCLTQKYGPDGNVFITDWHDVGECHDDDGSHRSSGRIYKVVYDEAQAPQEKNPGPPDLKRLDSEQLVDLQLHDNAWYARHARRILQERGERGELNPQVFELLKSMFQDQPSSALKLRALWSLYVTQGADRPYLTQLLAHADEHVRAWAVRLLCDGEQPPQAVIDRFVQLADQDPSGLVRLHLASMLQRVESSEARWRLANALAQRVTDADDDKLQLMVWYGIEPLVPQDPQRALQLMSRSKLPIIRRHIARRLAEAL